MRDHDPLLNALHYKLPAAELERHRGTGPGTFGDEALCRTGNAHRRLTDSAAKTDCPFCRELLQEGAG